MKEKLTEKLVKENPQENIEQVVNRVDRYIANYPLVPINTKPAGMMTFIEFEHVVDVLPMQDEYKMPEVDVNDVDVDGDDDASRGDVRADLAVGIDRVIHRVLPGKEGDMLIPQGLRCRAV